MAFKTHVKRFLQDSLKKIFVISILAIIGGIVLGFMLKPNPVEAQTYEPVVVDQNADTEAQSSDTTGSSSDTAASGEQGICDDIEKPTAKMYCVEKAVAQVDTGDSTYNVRTDSQQSTVAGVQTIASILLPMGDEETEEQAQSPYWRSVYAAIPEVRKLGVLGMVEVTNYAAMLYNPVPASEALYAYSHYFVPESVRNFASTQVNAGLMDAFQVLGNPPSSDNAFSILQPVIGGWWLSIFKLSTGIFVIVLIGAGLMIILRQKVGQNTVTVYMAIKNLVIGYVGAFLSFGIGTFFFNLSKWLMVIIARLIWSAWPKSFTPHIFFLDSVGGLSWFFFKISLGNYLHNTFVNDLKNIFSGGFISTILGGVGSLLGHVVMLLPGLIIQIAIAVYAIVIFTKILVKTIKIYTSMLIDIILAPLIFLMGAIPGNENTIKEWFTRMLKGAIKVPLMFFIVNLGMMFAGLNDLTLKAISGGALNTGTSNFYWVGLGLNTIIPITVISTANGIDQLIDQMWGGPSKSGAALAQGAQAVMKGMPILGGAME